jgi:hypothetical protein
MPLQHRLETACARAGAPKSRWSTSSASPSPIPRGSHRPICDMIRKRNGHARALDRRRRRPKTPPPDGGISHPRCGAVERHFGADFTRPRAAGAATSLGAAGRGHAIPPMRGNTAVRSTAPEGADADDLGRDQAAARYLERGARRGLARRAVAGRRRGRAWPGETPECHPQTQRAPTMLRENGPASAGTGSCSRGSSCSSVS